MDKEIAIKLMEIVDWKVDNFIEDQFQIENDIVYLRATEAQQVFHFIITTQSNEPISIIFSCVDTYTYENIFVGEHRVRNIYIYIYFKLWMHKIRYDWPMIKLCASSAAWNEKPLMWRSPVDVIS